MQKLTRFVALALPALLLAGCAAPWAGQDPAASAATVETAAVPAPQSLRVYASDALMPALTDYAAAQGVELSAVEDPAQADLLALDHTPGDLVEGLDVNSDSLLAAAAARAGVTEGAALPVGRSLYGYWANGAMLESLLGEGGTQALQTASWEEWSDFVETLQAWLEEPGAATVTLSGSS